MTSAEPGTLSGLAKTAKWLRRRDGSSLLAFIFFASCFIASSNYHLHRCLLGEREWKPHEGSMPTFWSSCEETASPTPSAVVFYSHRKLLGWASWAKAEQDATELESGEVKPLVNVGGADSADVAAAAALAEAERVAKTVETTWLMPGPVREFGAGT